MCEDVLNGFRAHTCYKSYLEIHFFFFPLDNSQRPPLVIASKDQKLQSEVFLE